MLNKLSPAIFITTDFTIKTDGVANDEAALFAPYLVVMCPALNGTLGENVVVNVIFPKITTMCLFFSKIFLKNFRFP